MTTTASRSETQARRAVDTASVETSIPVSLSDSRRPFASEQEVFDFEGFCDSRLVELSRGGNHEAFGELVRRYEARLLRVIGRFIIDQQTAEDIAQDVFLRVFRRMELFDSSRRFGPWLFQVAVNMTLDHLRRTRRRIKWSLFSQRANVDAPELDPTTPDPRAAMDLSQDVRHALEQVPEKYRTVLILRDLENFSTSEIAAILNRKEATIRWRLAEARKKFQKLWTARLDRENGSIDSEVDADELQEGPEADRTLDRT